MLTFSVPDEVGEMRRMIGETQEKLNASEQYSRRNNLRIFELKEELFEENKNTREAVIDLFKTKLGLHTFDDMNIDKAHRVGKFSNSNNTQRAVIVRLCNQSTAEHVLSQRRKLKSSGITITEDLTKRNVTLLKQVKSLDNVTQAWSKNGKYSQKEKVE